jgi:hypothetical protein
MGMVERAETPTGEAAAGTARDERPPFMQRLLDNPFLLLFLGVTLPTVLYLIWGILEIAQIPLSPS